MNNESNIYEHARDHNQRRAPMIVSDLSTSRYADNFTIDRVDRPAYTINRSDGTLDNSNVRAGKPTEILISIDLHGDGNDEVTKSRAELLSRILTETFEADKACDINRITLQDPPKGRKSTRVVVSDFDQQIDKTVGTNRIVENPTNMRFDIPSHVTNMFTCDRSGVSNVDAASSPCKSVHQNQVHNQTDYRGRDLYYANKTTNNGLCTSPNKAFSQCKQPSYNNQNVSPSENSQRVIYGLEKPDDHRYFVYPDLTHNTNINGITHCIQTPHPFGARSNYDAAYLSTIIPNTKTSTALENRPISSAHEQISYYNFTTPTKSAQAGSVHNAHCSNTGDAFDGFSQQHIQCNLSRSPCLGGCSCGYTKSPSASKQKFMSQDEPMLINHQRFDSCKRNLFASPTKSPQQTTCTADDVIQMLKSRNILHDEQVNVSNNHSCQSYHGGQSQSILPPSPSYQVIVIPQSPDTRHRQNYTHIDDIVYSPKCRSYSSTIFDDSDSDRTSIADKFLELSQRLLASGEKNTDHSQSSKRKLDFTGDVRTDSKRQCLHQNNKRQPSSKCACAEFENHVLNMAARVYRNVQRRGGGRGAFKQFQQELTETNAIVLDSLRMLNDMKQYCKVCCG